MSLKSAPFYWVECDRCGISAEEGGDHAAWIDTSVALDSATNADFFTVEDTAQNEHYCLECASYLGLWDDEE